MQIPFLSAFLLAISSSAGPKLLGSSRTYSTTNTTSALNSLHWLPIQQRINFKLATLVHRSLHNAAPQYLSSLLHRVSFSFALPPSISSPNLVSTLLLPLVAFDMLALLFGMLSLVISDLPTVMCSNPITKLTFSLVRASLAPNKYK